MASRVAEIQGSHGFDPAGPTPWQMVPLGGSRALALIDAPDLNIVFAHRSTGVPATGAVAYHETTSRSAARREIWVAGLLAGSYDMLVGPSIGCLLKVLELDVLAERSVRLMFYFLRGVSRWDTARLTTLARGILFNPANVGPICMGAYPRPGDLDLPANLPRQVDLDNAAHVTELRDHVGNYASGVSVYFVSDISGSTQASRVSGLSRGMRILLNTVSRTPGADDAKMARTLAHEIGHIFSSANGPNHDEQPTDLMFGHTTAHQTGLRLSRRRVLQLHGQ